MRLLIMNITSFARHLLGRLALVGMLVAPFSLCYATELTGRPVPVGDDRAQQTASLPAQAASAQAPAAQADSSVRAVSSVASAASVVSTAANEPAAPAEPQIAEPTSPPESVDQAGLDHAMEEFVEHNVNHNFAPMMSPDVIVPIVAMTLLFGGPIILVIVLVLLSYRAKARRQQDINRNIDKLLAAGRDIPVELLRGDDESFQTPENNLALTKGIKNICVGIGLLIFLTILCGIKIGAVGFIVISVGISQLLIWKLSKPINTHAVTSSATSQD